MCYEHLGLQCITATEETNTGTRPANWSKGQTGHQTINSRTEEELLGTICLWPLNTWRHMEIPLEQTSKLVLVVQAAYGNYVTLRPKCHCCSSALHQWLFSLRLMSPRTYHCQNICFRLSWLIAQPLIWLLNFHWLCIDSLNSRVLIWLYIGGFVAAPLFTRWYLIPM